MVLGRIGESGRRFSQRAILLDWLPPSPFVAAGRADIDWSRARAAELRVARSSAMRLALPSPRSR